MNEFHILFTSGGRRASLIQSFRKALHRLGLEGRIIVAEMNNLAAANFVADTFELVPRVTDPSYVDRVLEICRRHRVRLVVPLIDTELHLLSPHRPRFADEGIELLVCDTETNELCLDKRLTNDFFHRIDARTPKLLPREAVSRAEDLRFPLIVKPATGSCSYGLHRVTNARDLLFFADYVPNAIIQELAPGKEYTVDVLAWEGEVLCAIPRLRIETRAGEISKGRTARLPMLIEETKRVVEQLPGARGCLTVQCFVPESPAAPARPSYIEINPRFGGGVPLSIEAGGLFPEWIVRLLTDDVPREERLAWQSNWVDGLVMLRYDDAVFIRGVDDE